MNEAHISVWRAYPDSYFNDVLGVERLEGYQKQLSYEIVKHKKSAIKACHSVGKTWLMSRIALWFFNCYRNSIVITTAPTYKQVEKLLWGELREAYHNSKIPVGGRLLTTELKESDKWYCVGLSPKKDAGDSQGQKGSSFQGFHSDYVLIIFDEATGVDVDIWKMADGLLTSGKMVKFVAIGNPTTKNCRFYECFKSPSWRSLTLSCFDSPNLKANGFHTKDDLKKEISFLQKISETRKFDRMSKYKNPVPHLLSADWVVEYLLEWGFEHPLVVSKVFGEFPEEDENTLISMASIEAAQSRECDIKWDDPRFIGVDVARYGTDKSVLTEIIGYKETSQDTRAKQDTMEIAGAVVKMINNENSTRRTIVLIDCTGLGSGVFDSLVESRNEGVFSKQVELIEIHFGSSPVLKSDTDKAEVEQVKKRFFNLKARMFQYLANDIKESLAISENKNYLKELPMIKAKVDSKSKIRIESKDEFRARIGGASPDYSDSLALANFGRYVNISYGSFVKLQKTESEKVARKNFIGRKSRIRIKEY